MRIEELNIGDWVQVDGVARQVWRVDGSGLVSLRLLANPVAMGVIKPIPLTSEILEKNGFEQLALSARRWENQALAIAAVRDNEKGCWIICEADLERRVFFEMCVENVHELQHTLRLVGVERDIEV